LYGGGTWSHPKGRTEVQDLKEHSPEKHIWTTERRNITKEKITSENIKERELGRPGRRWKDIIIINVQECKCKVVQCVQLAQDWITRGCLY
jgi:hypothetical protein